MTEEELVAQGIPRDRAVLGARLSRLRVAEDWSRQTLATNAGINAVQVTGIEVGRRRCDFWTLVKLAEALKLRSLDELIGEPHLPPLFSGSARRP